MEESVKSRTIEFVKAKGIKMKVFEERCGLSSGYVTSMRKGFGPDKLTKKKRLRLFWVKPLVVSYVCVPISTFSGTFIFVSRTCKSARLNKLVTHHR